MPLKRNAQADMTFSVLRTGACFFVESLRVSNIMHQGGDHDYGYFVIRQTGARNMHAMHQSHSAQEDIHG
ncbi:MAG: hypothetical protein OEV15_02365, partial [Gallionella sp.]|nr:hypothetical protein [Gallionella sp.]